MPRIKIGNNKNKDVKYLYFELSIKDFVFSSSSKNLSDVLDRTPLLKKYITDAGLVRVQKFAFLTRNPLALPLQDNIPGVYKVIVDGKVRSTYLTNNTEGDLSQLVRVAEGTSMTISLLPIDSTDLSIKWNNGKTAQFNMQDKTATIKVTMSKAGEYILKTPASPLPLIIKVISVSDTVTIVKPTSWFDSEYRDWETDRKSTRLNSVTLAHLVCRLLLEKKKKKK